MKARADVAAMLRAGATYRQIITELHVSPITITTTRKALGIPVPPGRPSRGESPRPPREDIAELLRAGATYAQIHAKLGASTRAINQARKAFNIPPPKGPGRRHTPQQKAAYEPRALQLLRAGATYAQIHAELGLSAPTITALRRRHNIPARKRARPSRTRAQAFELHTQPYGSGHLRWTGPWAGSMPQLYAEGLQLNARHVSFRQRYDRDPDGNVRVDCGEPQCVAGDHLTDRTTRERLNTTIFGHTP